jgi:hypothetical protein
MHKILRVVVAAQLFAGCWAATPRLEDAHAPRDFYAQVHPKEPTCDRDIAMLPPGAEPGRPNKEVASLSATCSPGALEVCDARMKERACELGADAVVLLETSPGPNPIGASSQRLVSRNGRAIRWMP